MSEDQSEHIWENSKEHACRITGLAEVCFVRHCATVFHRGCAIYHPHQQGMGVFDAVMSWTLAILTGVQWHLIILTRISLMTCDMVHTFIHLCAICVSFLVRCLLRPLAHFKLRLFVFSLTSFKSSLYILENSPTSDVSSANIFAQPVAYFLILLTEQMFFILMKSSFSILSDGLCLLSCISKAIVTPRATQVYPHAILLKVF